MPKARKIKKVKRKAAKKAKKKSAPKSDERVHGVIRRNHDLMLKVIDKLGASVTEPANDGRLVVARFNLPPFVVDMRDGTVEDIVPDLEGDTAEMGRAEAAQDASH